MFGREGMAVAEGGIIALRAIRALPGSSFPDEWV